MTSTHLYDDDICAWADQQAAALRGLAGRRDLPNQLDLGNVIEEIEDVGRNEIRAVESLVENVLVHLILLATDPDAPAIRDWRGEITAWTASIQRRVSPSMPGRIDMQGIWRAAVRIACARLSDWDEDNAVKAKTALGGTFCPLTIAAFCAEEFEVADAVDRVRSVWRASGTIT
jgi:hypothetical protein